MILDLNGLISSAKCEKENIANNDELQTLSFYEIKSDCNFQPGCKKESWKNYQRQYFKLSLQNHNQQKRFKSNKVKIEISILACETENYLSLYFKRFL